MSDHPQGPGWWLASDGRYYPPESANVNPRIGDEGSPQWTAPHGGGVPDQPPLPQHHLHYGGQGGPMPGGVGVPGPAGQKSVMPGWVVALIVIGVLLVLGVGGCVLLLNRGANAVGDAIKDAADQASSSIPPGVGETSPEFLAEASCRASSVDEFDDYVIELTVRNPTDGIVTYVVEVRVTETATGDEVGTESLFQFGVDAGAEVTAEQSTFIDATVPVDEVSCEPVTVSR